MHDEVGGAIVNKALEGLLVRELQVGEHVANPLLAVGFVGHVPILLDDVKALHEMPLSKIFDHVRLELAELATRNVDHLLVVVGEGGSLVVRHVRGRRPLAVIVSVFVVLLGNWLLREG